MYSEEISIKLKGLYAWEFIHFSVVNTLTFFLVDEKFMGKKMYNSEDKISLSDSEYGAIWSFNCQVTYT